MKEESAQKQESTIIAKINEFFENPFWKEFDTHVMQLLNPLELLGKFLVFCFAMGFAQTYVKTRAETIMLLGAWVAFEAIKIITFNVMRSRDDYSGFKKYITIALDILTRGYVLAVAYDGSLHSVPVTCTILICEVIRILSFIIWHKGHEENFVRLSQILTLIEVTIANIVILTI